MRTHFAEKVPVVGSYPAATHSVRFMERDADGCVQVKLELANVPADKVDDLIAAWEIKALRTLMLDMAQFRVATSANEHGIVCIPIEMAAKVKRARAMSDFADLLETIGTQLGDRPS